MRSMFCFLLAHFFLNPEASAQKRFSVSEPYRSDIIFGFEVGVNTSVIKDIRTTIIPEPIFTSFNMDSKKIFGDLNGTTGTSAGFFINYWPERCRFGAQFDLMYAYLPSTWIFNNTATDFNYFIKFNYQYINLAPALKFYLAKNKQRRNSFNAVAGMQFGINVATNNIKYESWGAGKLEAFGSDLHQQQQLRNVLKGKNSLSGFVGLGFEFRRLVVFEARLHRGLLDVVETDPNSYIWDENYNPHYLAEFRVGLYFDGSGKRNR